MLNSDYIVDAEVPDFEMEAIQKLENDGVVVITNLLDKNIANQEIQCSAKIRSTQTEMSGKLKITDDSGYFLFDQPISATSPGQACVFYKNDQVLGGGWVT